MGCVEQEKGGGRPGIPGFALHLFNLAMLARQGWRIVQNPDSLCAQILMAKYGSSGSLLSAREGSGISYT